MLQLDTNSNSQSMSSFMKQDQRYKDPIRTGLSNTGQLSNAPKHYKPARQSRY